MVSHFSEDEDENDDDCRGLTQRTIVEDAYFLLFEHGDKGYSINDIQRHLRIDFYLARSIVRLLDRRNVVDSKRVECGRQNIIK